MMMMMTNNNINNEYKKIIEDYKNNKIEHKEIKEQLNKTNVAIKIYRKNNKFFKNIPNIKNKMNKNEKITKMLKNVLNEIISNKIYKESSTKKLLILHGLMIQNYLIKLTMMLLLDIVKTKIQLNYYLFKTF